MHALQTCLSARVKINRHCGILNVDLICSCCCGFEFSCLVLQWGTWVWEELGRGFASSQHKITEKIKVNKIKRFTLLVIAHSAAPVNLHSSYAYLMNCCCDVLFVLYVICSESGCT